MKTLLSVCLLAVSVGWTGAPNASSQIPPLQKGVSVQMAVTNNASPMPEADKQDAWVIAVTATGELYFGTQPVTAGQLVEEMKMHPRNRNANNLHQGGFTRALCKCEEESAGSGQVGLVLRCRPSHEAARVPGDGHHDSAERPGSLAHCTFLSSSARASTGFRAKAAGTGGQRPGCIRCWPAKRTESGTAEPKREGCANQRGLAALFRPGCGRHRRHPLRGGKDRSTRVRNVVARHSFGCRMYQPGAGCSFTRLRRACI